MAARRGPEGKGGEFEGPGSQENALASCHGAISPPPGLRGPPVMPIWEPNDSLLMGQPGLSRQPAVQPFKRTWFANLTPFAQVYATASHRSWPTGECEASFVGLP